MDRFDDIWRNKFQHEDVKVEPWNTPSEKSWEAIISGIRKHKRRKMIFPFLFSILSIGALVIVLLFSQNSGLFEHKTESALSENNSGIFQNQDTQTINPVSLDDPKNNYNNQGEARVRLGSYIEKNIKIQNLQSEEYYDISETFLQLPLARNGAESEIELENFFVDETGVEFKTQTTEKHTKLSTTTAGDHQPTTGTFEAQTTEISVNLKNLTSETKFPLNLIQEDIFLQPLQIYFFESSPSIRTRLFEFYNPRSNKKITPDQYWSIGFYISPFLWRQHLSRSYTEMLSPFDFDYTKNNFGLKWGIDINKRLNQNLEIYLQPGYFYISGTSGHNSTLSYLLSDESEGHHSNHYSIEMATPFGFAAAEFQLIRKGELPDHEVELNPVFKSKHNLQGISLPFGLRYFPLRNHSTFEPYMNLGVVVNRIIKLENTLDKIQPGHDFFDYKTLKGSNELTDNLKKSTLGVSLGFGSKFNLNRNISLNINYIFSYGPEKINQPSVSSSYAHTHNMNFSINKKINKN